MIVRLLICTALMFTAPFAFAGYAQLSPPPTWGGSPGAWTSSSAANASAFAQTGWTAPGGTINVGGQTVQMSARYRLAANAGRFAANAIRLNPALALGGAALTWIATECLEHGDGGWRVTCGEGQPVQSDGFEYRYRSSLGGVSYSSGWLPSKPSACAAFIAAVSAQDERPVISSQYIESSGVCEVRFRSCPGEGCNPNNYLRPNPEQRESTCPVGWYQTDQGCVEHSPGRPATQDDWDRLANKPMPQTLPQQIPGDWPVDLPSIVPTRIPTGLPVPVPGTDPQEYTQPIVDVEPAPTTQAPWRVSVTPKDVPVTDPANVPQEPTPIEDPSTPPGSVRPPEGVCEQYPDILACQKLGQIPEAVPVPNEDVELSITPDSGWGEGGGSCPAPTSVTVRGQTIADDWTLMCDFATSIRPVVIGVAWVIAGFTFFGFARRD